jgi:hypothetical protein
MEEFNHLFYINNSYSPPLSFSDKRSNENVLRDRLKMWQFFSNEVSFIWLRPPTDPLQMKVWKTEYRCIINQTPPNRIGFKTMYSPCACHDKGSIYAQCCLHKKFSYRALPCLILIQCNNKIPNAINTTTNYRKPISATYTRTKTRHKHCGICCLLSLVKTCLIQYACSIILNLTTI